MLAGGGTIVRRGLGMTTEDIKDVNTYHEDTFASLSDESVLEVERNLFIEKLPTNSWKPIIPSRDPVSVTPSPFSWLPRIDIPQPVQNRNGQTKQTYWQHSFYDDWVTLEHSIDAEETDILVVVADDDVKDAVKEVTTDNSSAYQTRLRPIRKHQYFRQSLPFNAPFHRRMGKYTILDRKAGLRLGEWNSPVVDRLLEVRWMDMTCTVLIISPYQVLVPVCLIILATVSSLYSGYDGRGRRSREEEMMMDRAAVRMENILHSLNEKFID